MLRFSWPYSYIDSAVWSHDEYISADMDDAID